MAQGRNQNGKDCRADGRHGAVGREQPRTPRARCHCQGGCSSGQVNPADWWCADNASMGPVVIVPGEPTREVGVAAIRGAIGRGAGPFAQQRLDETLGFAIGPRRGRVRIWRRPPTSGFGKEPGDLDSAAVGHTRSTLIPRWRSQRSARARKPVVAPRDSSPKTSTQASLEASSTHTWT